MTLAYVPRLLCIGMAAFFLVHIALGLAVSAIARPALHWAERMRPHRAAWFLLALRLAPSTAAASIVIAVCLPSYLWLEPHTAGERVGFACLAAAVMGAALWCASLARGLRAAAGSHRFLRNCRRAGHPARAAARIAETWIIDGAAPLLAVGGILRPRLVISRGVMAALSPQQLAAALRHERAHWTSHDNLKRLCMLLTPGILPFGNGTRSLERGWGNFTEWAADDRAVEGSARRSYALAAALVRVARMTAGAPRSALVHPLLGDTDRLEARVDRLLRPPAPAAHVVRTRPVIMWGAILAITVSLAVAILQPAALYSVHVALEHLLE